MSILLKYGVILILFVWATKGKPADDSASNSGKEQEQAKEYLNSLESRYSEACNIATTIRWSYITNVTDENEKANTDASNVFSAFQSNIQKEIRERFPNWKIFTDPDLKRQFQNLAIRGPSTMPKERVDKMNALQTQMESLYAKATICEYKNPEKCNLRLEPEITEKLKTSKDFDELSYYWTAWHDAINKVVSPEDYEQFVAYLNEYANANGFNDMGDLWTVSYDDGVDGFSAQSFKIEMARLWSELKPIYAKLHAYVRMKLRGSSEDFKRTIKRYGYLPANIMGNMWSQDWSTLEKSTKPFPNAPSLDATSAIKAEGYTAKRIFEESDKFFEGLGLLKMTDSFWEKSMLERPEGREVVCHASAEDFCMGKGSKDFRIKQCTEPNMEHLVTAHHEMGHIEYFMQYQNQPFVYRDGANPGFHEAIGDALALAVTTPKHLQCSLKLKMGLDSLCHKEESGSVYKVTETDVNFLYRMALEKFAFFPFAISMDTWRFDVFSGKVKKEDYNKHWWNLRKENQGIVPPTQRPDDMFDPAAKYHIPANVEYIRYFISHILQFQFYESMCIAAGEYNPDDVNSKPLFSCDFSGNKKAGEMFGEMMKLGFSKHWPEALKILTGSEKMSMKSLLNYFQPLFDKIDKELIENEEVPCFGKDCEGFAEKYLQQVFEQREGKLCNEAVVASWDQATDTTNTTAEDLSIKASLKLSSFINTEWKSTTSQFDYANFTNPLTKRQLKFLNFVGTSALEEKDLERFNKITVEMSNIYGQAKICPYENKDCDIKSEGLSLTPDIEKIVGGLEDYDELSYVWEAWRDASGKKLKNIYNEYINLSNKAAALNDAEPMHFNPGTALVRRLESYPDMGEFWVVSYESDTFKKDMEDTWKDMSDMYKKLHGYVRFKLSKKFPQIDVNKPLPAHILGNMWGQTWENVYKYVVPFPDSTIFDITESLKNNFTDDSDGVYEMFEVANKFFTDLGLSDMSMSFGPKAMIVKPKNKVPICHASAWDFCDKSDYRIKMCTGVKMDDFITIHHELGHIQYFINYNNKPSTFRQGANPGFHESIGDLISLSVNTPKHMQEIGLLEKGTVVSRESTLNYLMKQALDKIAFLPFGFLIDSYRWKVFSGEIPREKLNYHWIRMINEFQGIVPPVKRTESDFDAGAKYHVPGDTPYIRYFFSFILQFQLHKALCETAGQYPANPLYDCDINKNQEAGEKLKKILEAGSSQRWQDILKESIGQDKLDSSAIKEYFSPLITFLDEEQAKENYPIGWENDVFEQFYTPESA